MYECVERHEGNGTPTPFLSLVAGLALVESQQTDPGARSCFRPRRPSRAYLHVCPMRGWMTLRLHNWGLAPVRGRCWDTLLLDPGTLGVISLATYTVAAWTVTISCDHVQWQPG